MGQLVTCPAAGGGSTYDVSPPAATTESTAAGVGLAGKTFGAFGGADAGSIDGYTARTVNASGATSWSGSGLGAYTPSGGADGDAGVLALDATIGGVVVATALHDYTRAAAAGGATRLYDVDFTANITDLTLTVGGGDTTLYESDGTTPKATVGAWNRVTTPSTSTAAITAANGGGKVQNAGTNTSTDLYTRITAASIGADFTDPSKVYMVSIRVSGQSLVGADATFGMWISPAADFSTTNGSWGGQQYRNSGTSYRLRGIRYLAGGFGVGASLDDDTSARDTVVVTCILYRGRLADVYITEGATIPSGFPSTGAALFLSRGGADAVAIDATMALYGADLYLTGEVYTNSGSTSEGVIERITVDEWSL
jgi:hypothetical protein